jgi:hypothetical protein
VNKDLSNGKTLSPVLRKHLKGVIESEIASQYKEFILCSNHLGEFKYLTDTEISGQHEFFPHHDSITEKLFKKLATKSKIKTPQTSEVNLYIAELRDQITQDIEKRLTAHHDKKETARKRFKLQTKSAVAGKEVESVYRSNPDYKLYENHLGERRWLTQDEFNNQDEFTEEIIPTSRILWNIAKWVVPVLLILTALFYFLKPSFIETLQKGYMIVEANEVFGQLYIDDKLKLGFSPGDAITLPKGKYTIIYRKSGFKSIPPSLEIDISARDTSRIRFNLIPANTKETSVIRLQSSHDDAKLFIENDYFGTAKDNSEIFLNPGKYRIAMKKEGYNTIPPFYEIVLNKADTTDISFQFVSRLALKDKNNVVEHGMIEVTSNVPDARIILDGKDTGYGTDYIFNKIQLGQHVVSLKSDGYIIQPEEKTIRLTKLSNQQRAHFTLKKSDLDVTFKTSPVKGKIYLDGKELGSGEWKGGLSPGKYKIQFGDIQYYKKPTTTTIEIGRKLPTSFIFKYTPTFKLTFSPQGILPRNDFGSIQLGYMGDDHVFQSDPNNAPELVFLDQFSEQVWILGYAFAYRNPPENDAIEFTFNIPTSIDLSNNMWLKMWGYRTDENYPLEFTSISEIRISVNNRVIQDDLTAKYTLDQAGESNYEQFRINNLIRHGRNRLRISTSAVNTVYFALWKISIE